MLIDATLPFLVFFITFARAIPQRGGYGGGRGGGGYGYTWGQDENTDTTTTTQQSEPATETVTITTSASPPPAPPPTTSTQVIVQPSTAIHVDIATEVVTSIVIVSQSTYSTTITSNRPSSTGLSTIPTKSNTPSSSSSIPSASSSDISKIALPSLEPSTSASTNGAAAATALPKLHDASKQVVIGTIAYSGGCRTTHWQGTMGIFISLFVSMSLSFFL